MSESSESEIKESSNPVQIERQMIERIKPLAEKYGFSIDQRIFGFPPKERWEIIEGRFPRRAFLGTSCSNDVISPDSSGKIHFTIRTSLLLSKIRLLAQDVQEELGYKCTIK